MRTFGPIAELTYTGLSRTMVHTTDRHVVVIAVVSAQNLTDLQTFWVAFGLGKGFHYIPAHTVA